MNLATFVLNQRYLLEQERAAELEESNIALASSAHSELQDKGVVILKLSVREVSTGLGGKPLITFERVSHMKDRILPAHKLSPGEIVGVFASSSGGFGINPLVTGVVQLVRTDSVTLVLDSEENPLDEATVYQIAMIGNDVTHKRMMSTLEKLERNSEHPIVSACFGGSISEASVFPDIVCNELNSSQKSAIEKSLAASSVALIQGPPGTGKTTTLVGLISEFLKNKKTSETRRVLVCAPSNAAVDNLAESLLKKGIQKMVRLGHPSRVAPGLTELTLSSLVEDSDGGKLCADIREEISGFFKSKGKYSEIKTLKKELRKREEKEISDILQKSTIVLSTCVGAGLLEKLPIPKHHEFFFDLCIIDEAAQALEAACWIPVLSGKCKKLILAGDHKQLAPTICSKSAERGGLGKTLFARLAENTEISSSLLTVQYRMNADIMAWSNESFYNGQVTSHSSVESIVLNGLVNNYLESCAVKIYPIELPLVWIDTGNLFSEEFSDSNVSKCNPGEVGIVQAYVDWLLLSGIQPECIGVITPYSSQVTLLRSVLPEQMHNHVATVDSFQGREREIVIISMVRSNDAGDVGFLADERRMNVAITRAKRQVVIIGDSLTVCNDPKLSRLYDHCLEIGEVYPVETFFDIQMLAIPQIETHKAVSSKFTTKVGNIVKEKQKATKSVKNRNSSHSKQCDDLITESPKLDETFETCIKCEIEKAEDEIKFPCSLSSYERSVVHSVAESMGLYHESIGEGNERAVIVRKTHKSVDVQEVKAQVNRDNLLVEKIKPPRKQTSKVVKAQKKPSPAEEEEDFDAIVAEFNINICGMIKCEAKVSVHGINCEYCKRRYCYTHLQAEIHGCGQLASNKAKSDLPQRPLPSWKNKEIKSKLFDKIKAEKNRKKELS